jgi:hypothetical protein
MDRQVTSKENAVDVLVELTLFMIEVSEVYPTNDEIF